MKEKISSRRVNKVKDWLIGYEIPDMSALSVKDRNKRKSGHLSSDEDSIALNPEKKHEGSYTFNSEAAVAAASSAMSAPGYPPRGDPNRPLPPLPGQEQIYDNIDGKSSTASGPIQPPTEATTAAAAAAAAAGSAGSAAAAAALLAAAAAAIKPSWPPKGQPQRSDTAPGTATNAPGSTPGTFKPPTNEDLMDVCVQMSQELGQDQEQGGAETFASRAKKAKRFFPYTVFIVSGENTDESLDKRHYVAFQEFIWQARIKLTFEENEKVKIEWMSFHGTYGMVACDDKATASWVRSKAQVFKFEEKSTRSYYQWERQESVVFGVFLKGPMFRQKQMKPNWALGQIFKANNLVGDFRNVSWDTKRNPGGVYLEFEPCGQDLILKLDGMSTLNCLTCKPTLNKRVRKAKSEEEFLAGLKKDPQLRAQNLAVIL